jgi:hypothetical protein
MNAGSGAGGVDSGGAAAIDNAAGLGGEGSASAGSGGIVAGADPSPWLEWSGTPMPNPPSSGLPNPQRYSVVGGAVKDEVTGLLWQRQPKRLESSFSDAQAYCAGLELSGASFRLPRLIELITLLDFTTDEPAMDGEAFFVDSGIDAWATTVSPGALVQSPTGQVERWTVNYYALNVDANAGGGDDALCVSGGPPAALGEHYTVGSDTVIDHWTGLTWSPSSATQTFTFDEAVARCNDLGKDGEPWRLPSMNEAMTLIDFSQQSPKPDATAFPDYAFYGMTAWIAPRPLSDQSTDYQAAMLGGGLTWFLSRSTGANAICVH